VPCQIRIAGTDDQQVASNITLWVLFICH
jgi:hypothetical protein